MPDRIRTIENGALLVALAVTAAVCWKFFDYGYDDAYITYRYARNIAAGHGFVYNLEHNFLGTTTPLYTLILALAGLAFDIPRTSAWLTCASLLGCIVIIEALGRRSQIRFSGATAAIFLSLSLPIYRVWGTETIFVYFLLVPLGYSLHRSGRTRLAALVLGLAILARMDAVLFTGLLFATRAWQSRRWPIAEGLVMAAVLLPWFVYSLAVFGAPFPSTLWAKIAQGQSGLWPLFLDGATHDFAGLVEYRPGWRWISFVLVGLGLYRIAVRERVWAIFVASSVLFVLAYQVVLGVSFSKWYLANLWLTNALVLAAGSRQAWALASDAGRRLEGRRVAGSASARWPTALLAAPLVLLLLLVVAEKSRGVLAFETWRPRRAAYTELGRWLHDHTPPDATVAFYEIGFIGYFSDRTILDPVGLVTPGGLDAIRGGDLWWVFDVYEPDYYIHRAAAGRSGPRARPDFDALYEEVYRLDAEGRARDLVVYGRRSP